MTTNQRALNTAPQLDRLCTEESFQPVGVSECSLILNHKVHAYEIQVFS